MASRCNYGVNRGSGAVQSLVDQRGVPLEWTQDYRRKLYFSIEPYVKRRQILLVYGLRRVGKTTLMMQVISSLLKFVNPRHILYF